LDILLAFFDTLFSQLQKPTLSFLIGGFVIAACGSRLEIPDPVYRFIVVVLLLKIGIGAGIEIRSASLAEIALPSVVAIALGVGIVLLGRITLAQLPGVTKIDAIATSGLFGAVSASTLAAAMIIMEQEGAEFEAWVPALYPFMDIAALLTAIVLAKVLQGAGSGRRKPASLRQIVKESLQGSALSALLLGLALGLLARPEPVYQSFYEPLFRGLLSILMLIMGMEAYQRFGELRRVAHMYALYGLLAPLVHGFAGLGVGWLIHQVTGFSSGGAVLLAVMAASSSDISGPPTLRAAIPKANPSTYIGASTSLGTPVALLSIPLFMAIADWLFAL